jgi:ATP-dependent helicase/nuclease subunit A
VTDHGFTDEQRAAIEDRAGRLILSANAGSGKTSVMVERFVAAALHDGVPVDEILAITFTDKAAAELRERIRARLVAFGDEVRARAVGDAHISTIHGFCARVLRAHPLLAGIDPAFEVADDLEAERMARDAFARAYDDLAEARGNAALDLGAAYQMDTLRGVVVAVHGRLRSEGQAHPILPPPPHAADAAAARDELRAAAAATAVELGAIPDDLKAVRDALDRLERCLAALEAAGQADLSLAEIAPLTLGNGAGALKTDTCERYRDALAAYRRACADRLAAPICGLLGELLERFDARYAGAKRARGRLDFDDLELMARDLLRGHPRVAESYRRRFRLVMVDEFQDTNRRQLEIVGAVTDGNDFTVGDEFQSIYRFRHADVGLFRTRRAELDAAGTARALQVNFRSHAGLLHTINASMGPLLGRDFLPLQPGREVEPDGPRPGVELLVTDRDGWSDAEGRPVHDFGDVVALAALWRIAEARMLAQRVRELLGSSRYAPSDVVVLLRAAGDIGTFERALEDQDVPTYLVGGRGYWSHPQVRDLVAWLAVVANPDDTLRLYEALASPLAAASSSALVLLADTAAGLERTPWWALREAVDGDGSDGLLERMEPGDSDRMAALARLLIAEREEAPYRSPDELIDRAVRATGYDLRVLAMPGGQRRVANLRKLMRLAREHADEAGHDLRTFVDVVDELAEERRSGADEGEAPVEGESEGPVAGSALNAVRLMTIHRAKGLEFPVVCIADLGRRPPAAAQEVLFVDGERIGLKVRTATGESVPALAYDVLLEEHKLAEREEEHRLLYVAMTRAQERLVVSGAVKLANWPAPDVGCAPIVWLGPALVPDVRARVAAGETDFVSTALRWGAEDVSVRVLANSAASVGTVLRPESLAPVPAPPDGEVQTPPEPPAPPPAPGRSTAVDHLSYSALEKYGQCGYRFYLENVLRLPARELSASDGAAPDEPSAPGNAPARLRGSIAHELLEGLDLTAPAPADPAEVRARARAHGADLDETAAAEVARLVDAFADSALRARLAAADDLRREAPFAFELPVPGGAPVLVTGVVDAMVREDRVALVVDYKSDRLGGEDPEERVERSYRIQRLIYALAALRAGAETVEVVHCFLERPDEPVTATYAGADVPALEERLQRLAAGALAGDFAVSASPHRELCTGCPGRGTLCSWPLAETFRQPASA